MSEVSLNESDYNFDIALCRLKKQVEKAGILSEMRKHQHFRKLSVMRKKKKAAACKRLLKKICKINTVQSFPFLCPPGHGNGKTRGLGHSIVLTGVYPILFDGAPPVDERSVSVFVPLAFPVTGTDDLVGDRGGYVGSPFGFPCFFNHHLLGIITSLTTRIEQDYIAAYKAKDVLCLGVLRLLKTATKNLQVELMWPVTDEELATTIQKQAERRQNSIGQFTTANRPDLAEKEAVELSVLKDYLPGSLSKEELTAAIGIAIATLGVTSMSGMGKVIQPVVGDYKDRMDGKAVSAAVKARLS